MESTCPTRASAMGLGPVAAHGELLPPQLHLGSGRKPFADLVQLGRRSFSKSSMAASFRAWWRGRAGIFRQQSARGSRPTVVSLSEMPNSFHIQCARSARRQRTTSWIAGIGPRSTSGGQSLTPGVVKLGRVARRLTVDQPGRAAGVEARPPVADRPRRPAPRPSGASAADLREREKPARPRRVLRDPREPSKSMPVEVISQQHTGSHGEPPSGAHHGFGLLRPWKSPASVCLRGRVWLASDRPEPGPDAPKTNHPAFPRDRRARQSENSGGRKPQAASASERWA